MTLGTLRYKSRVILITNPLRWSKLPQYNDLRRLPLSIVVYFCSKITSTKLFTSHFIQRLSSVNQNKSTKE